MRNPAFRYLALSIPLIGAFGLSGCGGGNATATGTTTIRMGASTVARGITRDRVCPAGGTASANGDHWRLSPTQAKVIFKKITFIGADGQLGSADLTACAATYDRTKASGTSLLDCPVAVPVGTITRMLVNYSTSFDINIEDSTNCIFTDSTKASGLSSIPPASAANKFATFVATGQQNANGDFVADIQLPVAKVIAKGDAPKISIVTDMIHSMFATAGSAGNGGGVLTYDAADVHAPVNVFASFSDSGKAEFYTPTGTAESKNFGSSTSESAVRIFYYSDATPTFEMNDSVPSCVMGNYPTQSTNANPAKSAANKDNSFKSGGYLGIDSSNVIAWALPVDFSYGTYRSLLTMTRQTVLGTHTTLKCKFLNGTAAPVPTSGDVYATSNASLVPTPDGTVDEILVAN